MPPTLEYQDTIAILTLGSDENRFSPEFLDTIDRHLDEVETTAHGLITTGTGKFYSNGLDLEWLVAHPDRSDSYVHRVQRLFGRLLTFPMPTLAAVNGHAFGAGAMAALAHDYRIMRDDRGYFCFPEVEIDIPFTPGMAALIQAKLLPQTALTAMTTGHRYTADTAVRVGLVDSASDLETLTDTAVDHLRPLVGKTPATVAAIKHTMFDTVSAALNRGRSQP